VDSVTDAKIQQTMREQFQHCTVLTIAHRLETIADYDIVVVMQNGQVAEVGSPSELLEDDEAGVERSEEKMENRSRLFQGLIDELGPERKAAFLKTARSRRQLTASSSAAAVGSKQD
jgi:ABC-type multidrug transport system ATPase subunit